MRQTVHFLALLLWMAASTGPASWAATHWDVYLLAGQSNMDGRGRVAQLSETQREPLADVRIFYRNLLMSSETWKPLTPGYSVPPGYNGPLPSQSFGPELGFAQAMQKAYPAGHLALIKGSKGGTSLATDWNPGVKGQPDTQGPCYRTFIETIVLATKALTANGDTFTLRGMLWHQGESDAHAGDTTMIYQKRLTTFIARMREDLGQPDLPFVVGGLFDDGTRDAVNEALYNVGTTLPHTGFASVEGLKTLDPGTHFDTVSQITLGEHYAAAMLKLTEREKASVSVKSPKPPK